MTFFKTVSSVESRSQIMDPQLPTKNSHGRIQTRLESERCAFTISPPTIPRISDAESLRVFSGAPTWKGVCVSTRGSSSLDIVNCEESQRSDQSMGGAPDSPKSQIHSSQHHRSPITPLKSLPDKYYFTPLRITESESVPSSSLHTFNLLSSTSQSSSTIRPNSALSVDTLSSIDELGPSEDQPAGDAVLSDRRKSKTRRGTLTSVRSLLYLFTPRAFYSSSVFIFTKRVQNEIIGNVPLR